MNGPKYTSPLDSEVANAVNQLDEVSLHFWIERASIREYDGGLSRRRAEWLALQDVLRWQAQQKLPNQVPPSLAPSLPPAPAPSPDEDGAGSGRE